jgi:hypothetical protein
MRAIRPKRVWGIGAGKGLRIVLFAAIFESLPIVRGASCGHPVRRRPGSIANDPRSMPEA